MDKEFKIKHVVFIMFFPLKQRDYARFGVPTMLSHDLQIEVWNVKQLLFPRQGVEETPHLVPTRNIRSVQNLRTLLATIDVSQYCFITLLPYNFSTLRIFRLLTIFNTVYGFFSLGSNASMVADLPTRALVKRSATSLLKKPLWFLKRLLQKRHEISGIILRRFIPFQLFGIKRPTFNLVDGKMALSPAYPRLATSAEHIIWSHANDYETYLLERDKTTLPVIEKPYCVFLDENFADHPDYAVTGSTCPVTLTEYLQNMNALFSVIEQKLGVAVIIAGHPKSGYEKGAFQGRKIIVGQTCALVKHAKFVVAHGSTSVNFAVLFAKPIVFVSMRKIAADRNFQHPIESFANFFAKPILIIEDLQNFSFHDALVYKDEQFRLYRDAYIKSSQSIDKPTWEIFCDFLKNINTERKPPST